MKRRHRARFRRSVIAQVGLLLATSLALGYSLVSTSHVAVPVVVGGVIALQVLGLLHAVASHVDTLEEFFAAVNFEDFTRRFVADDVDAELKSAFNRILARFQDARAQRELQANYLETVVRHVPVPLMAVRSDGSLRLVNNPARRLTGLASLARLDDLATLDPDLPDRMRAIPPGGQRLLQTRLRHVPSELRVSVSELRLEGETERLYSIENLSGELTARESSAWRNLIRVLTHEIMNTLTPVTSLAQTCASMLDDDQAQDDVRDAIDTIARRSEGLMDFVARYRELLKVPQPRLAPVHVATAVHGVVTLLTVELEQTNVSVDIVPDSLTVQADANLLDQVLINGLRNAADASSEQTAPTIAIRARLDHGRVLIEIIDNGPGLPDRTLDQAFVPFFTTKRKGSGIGLSLSRQIMTAHGGDIAIGNTAEGTRLVLVF